MPITHKHAWRILKAAAVSGGLNADRISTHSLRKTFALEIYDASGHDLRATQVLLGHKDIQTTVKYLETDQNKLNGFVLNLPSRGRPLAVGPAMPSHIMPLPDDAPVSQCANAARLG